VAVARISAGRDEVLIRQGLRQTVSKPQVVQASAVPPTW
jgi:hypothetical protein